MPPAHLEPDRKRVRHRTVRTKGALSQDTARLMVFKLAILAARTWRRMKGEDQLPKLIQGVAFHNGADSPTRQHRMPPDHGVTQIPAWLAFCTSTAAGQAPWSAAGEQGAHEDESG
jgi:hypothetical protein